MLRATWAIHDDDAGELVACGSHAIDTAPASGHVDPYDAALRVAQRIETALLDHLPGHVVGRGDADPNQLLLFERPGALQ